MGELEQARQVVLPFSLAWGAWAALAIWVMSRRRPPARRLLSWFQQSFVKRGNVLVRV